MTLRRRRCAEQLEYFEVVVNNELDGSEQTGIGATAGVARSQNQLHVLPEDWNAAAGLVQPLLDRLDSSATQLQLLIVSNDAESAAALAARIAPAVERGGLRMLAATDARRGRRLLRATTPQVLVAAPAVIADLVQSALLKLDAVRVVVLAWVDALPDAEAQPLEAVMAELPKDSARIVVARDVTPAVEQLVERYARRARRMQSAAADELPAANLSYVVVSDRLRIDALRRILDTVDPDSAYVVSQSREAREAIAHLLRTLGYGEGTALVQVGDKPDTSTGLIVVFELPASAQELRALAINSPRAQLIVLVTARQIADLRRLAGGAVTPLSLPEAAARARTREDTLRDELRATLAAGRISREVMALEPLLAEHDGIEIAAAALRLLEEERARAATAATAATTRGSSAGAAMTRIYVNVGDTDGVRAGDLLGAITNEVGISKGDIGRVDIRDRHTIVEVGTAVANAVVAKLTGVNIRGRRVIAKIDETPERPPRPRRDDGPRRGPPTRRREDARKR